MTRPRHAYVVRDVAPIPPLGASAAEAWLLGGRLHDEMRRRLEAEGLAVERVDTMDDAVARAGRLPDGAIVTHDSVAFSRSVVRGLLAACDRDPRPALAAALPRALATRRLSHIAGLAAVTVDGTDAFTAPFYAIRAGGSASAAEPVLLPYRELEWKLPVPVGMLGHTEEPFGATDTYLVRVDHWGHILHLNIAAMIAAWFERGQTLAGKLWYLWRALLGFPWRRGRLAAAIRRVHRRAKIHHTAHVELSVVEAGAEIGPHAVVKNSYIARGARIDDGALVNACVVGEGAFVGSAAAVFSSVLYPGSFAAQHKMQFSVLGESSVAFTGSYFYDTNFDRNVHVLHRRRVVDSGGRFMSVCLGPWARVAGGVWIASGREVPAHALIVQPPERVLHRIDDALAATRMTAVADRALVDVGPLPGSPSRPEVAVVEPRRLARPAGDR
jgi:hypothetical protein